LIVKAFRRSISLRRLAAIVVPAGLLFLTSCSTVESRIKQNSAAFNSLSPSDQALVRNGQIVEGLPQAAVYIAWGPPDQTRSGQRNGKSYAAWVYTTTRTIVAPNIYPNFYRFGPYRYYGYWPGWYGDDYFFPYREDLVPIQVPYKTAFFESGRCTGWEYIN